MADEPAIIRSLRGKEGKIHAVVDYGAGKTVRDYTLTGPPGVDYGGTPTMGAAAHRSLNETWTVTPPAGSVAGEEHTFTLTATNENGPAMKSVVLPVVAVGGAAGPTVAYGSSALPPLGPLQVIYTEIAGDPTADVPGVLDAAGQPTTANFTALEDLSLRSDGGEWVLKARTDVFGGNDPIIIRGAGTSGTMFMQDGQPFAGGVPGELYDFFDSAPGPVSWNDNFLMGFSARAQGGVFSIKEKVVIYDPLLDTHTVVYTESTPVTGLIDLPPNPSGDELLGNSVSGVHLTNAGELRYICTPLQNCHSSRYPAFFHGNAGFRQSGVSLIDGEVWDNFDLGDTGGTPDGVHWYSQGDTEVATTVDDILAVDDAVVIRENTLIGVSGVTAVDVFFTRMLRNGDWFARGDDPASNDWAVRNGEVLVKTGDAVPTTKEGPVEHWGNALGSWNGNQLGEWILAGNTDIGDPNTDSILVFDGQAIVAREGDPVDVDGNGMFDDDAFIRLFATNDAFITDNADVIFLASLRNGVGTNLGNVFFMRLRETACPEDITGDGAINVLDLIELLLCFGQPATPPCDTGQDVNGDGTVNVLDLIDLLLAFGTSCP
jgi:hypothetical protein